MCVERYATFVEDEALVAAFALACLELPRLAADKAQTAVLWGGTSGGSDHEY